ncbi:MAG TPA: hypothetical protein VD931_03075 [Baekduia sp.]|nr:hypothetical protein [Baekduia sp.]
MLRHAVAGALAAGLLAASAPAASAAPTCLTPVAPHEPPCNPHLADSGWGASHRGSYASGASPFPAPRSGDPVRWQHVRLPGSQTQVPIVIDFSSPYPGGGRAAFMSVVSSPDVAGVHKVDVATGEVISSITRPTSTAGASITGAYNLLDRDDHLFVGRERSLDVFGDLRPRELRSPIAKLKALQLPDRALCGPGDKLVGITMTYDGMVAFATERGAVGVVPRALDRLAPGEVRALQLNDGRCDAPDGNLEIVSNSIAADEDGGIYVVTSKRMHRIQWDGRELSRAWSAAYETGVGGGVRLGDGSGSTPDVMGTGRDRDRFVVITDGQPLMHLVLLWRGDIPKDWQPIAPGKDRRIACEVPVRFGDPSATTSASEQSVLTSGYASIVVNNTLRNERALALLPPEQRRIVAALAGQDPVNAPYGLERIDWDPDSRTCRSIWANRDISIPNAIPTLSTASGLVYGQGQRGGLWGLEGLDLETGASKLRVAASPGPDSNSIYAATEVGPDGAIWQGVGGGIDIYRGPQRPGPELRCYDLEPPLLGRRVRVRGRVVSGTARDTACGERAPVQVRVRLAGARARTVKADGRGRWRVRLRGRRAATVAVQAVDAAGQTSAVRRRAVR